MKLKKLLFISLAIVLSMSVTASDKKKKKKDKEEGYEFTMIHDLKTSPVKSQQRVGSCWDYATTSFVETEIIRMKNQVYDLSEMFTIRHDYPNKAMKYIRYHGNNNFGQGGQAHDVLNVIEEYGFVPEDVYMGLNYGETVHNHSELTPALKGFLDGVKKKGMRKLSPVWMDAYEAILDVYLGEDVKEFELDGQSYTPKSFQNNTGFDTDDYVEITSYTHHPFYTQCNLEVPDNWSGDLYYNLPLDDMMKVINHSFEKGYSVCWDGDVSSAGFKHAEGYAVVLRDLTDEEKEQEIMKQDRPEEEITQGMRQEYFDKQMTTDDHLMHLTGMAKDQKGTIYYKTKNSWGPESNTYGGFLFMSESYIKMNTVAVLVHKDAIPEEIANKMFK